MAKSVDPDQILHTAASDLGLHCLQRPICPNTKGYYGIYFSQNIHVSVIVAGLTQDLTRLVPLMSMNVPVAVHLAQCHHQYNVSTFLAHSSVDPVLQVMFLFVSNHAYPKYSVFSQTNYLH